MYQPKYPKIKTIAAKMHQEGLPDIVIRTFEHYYHQLAAGQTGFISESEIEPVTDLPDADTFPDRLAEVGQATLPKTVFLKLNGGLGTSMGLDQAKSLLTVKDDLTFLDIIARHAQAAQVRLLLMNSFATRADSLAILKRYPALGGDIPLDFVQHKVPKINQADLSPATSPADPTLEWCPPGHGDIYTALVTSGMLETLLQAGYEYAFISNADNLGAIISPTILGYFAEKQIPFMMEVTDRTEADSKGGHLAQRVDGQLILREIAQCPEEDLDVFQDITRHKYFNTNNLWLNLPALQALLEAQDYILHLPMIRNAKTVDPREADSTPVYQLETAMGSVIAIFKGARAIRVPRTRFVPVKQTNDLLVLRSDVYLLPDDLQGIIPNPARTTKPPLVDLDPDYYKLVTDFEARFPTTPSLLECDTLHIKGDIKFGSNVTLKGQVQLNNETQEQRVIEDNAVIEEKSGDSDFGSL
jgi:UTP--glucose-1-phosphate uridylyltransferase